jgi:hypothetical protein
MASASCIIEGSADMYGIGIRIAFYLQWLASPLAAWVAPDEVPGLQTANAFFVSATFLGLIVQVVTNGLDVAEIYIILLFTFGVNAFLVPILLYRILSGFSSKWDFTQYPKGKPPSSTFEALFSIMQVAVVAFKVWFWAKKVPNAGKQCVRYGFIFAKVRLASRGFQIFNLVMAVVLLALILGFGTARLYGGIKASLSRSDSSQKSNGRDSPPEK